MIRAPLALPVKPALVLGRLALAGLHLTGLPLAGLLLLAPAALAAGLHLSSGATRVISLSAPAASFHIADPAVLDARAMDDSHVELIGKSAGNTEVVAYDAGGRRIYSNRVSVGGHSTHPVSSGNTGTVLYQRGTEQRVYSCSAEQCRAQTANTSAGTVAAAQGVPPPATVP